MPTMNYGYPVATTADMKGYTGMPKNPTKRSEVFGKKGGARNSCATRRARMSKVRSKKK